MNEKQAKAAFLKQVKPFTKRYAAERARKNPGRLDSKRQTKDFAARIAAGPVFVGEYTDAVRGRMSMFVPILFSLNDEFKPGVKIYDHVTYSRFLSLVEGA